MQELLVQLKDVVRVIWRRRWVGIVVAWGVAILGIAILVRMPDRFEATARVYVDTKSVLKPLMRDLAVEPDLEQTVALLARTIITRPNVELLMSRTPLVAPTATAAEREQVIEGLIRQIKLTSSGRDNIFTFSYRNPDRELARSIVQNLVALFVDSDLGAKRRDTEEAKSFIDEQIKNYEARLAQAENRLKDFKLRNLGVTDTAGKDYFSRIATLSEELERLSLDLRVAEQARDSLRRELEGENTNLVPDQASQALTIQTPEIDARLEVQQKQLDEQLRRYTDLHPDVIATRRLISRLEDQKKREIESRRRAIEADPNRRGNLSQPQQQVKLALAAAEASVTSTRVRVNEVQSRLKQLKSTANRVPQVEAELAQLNRDYDVIRRNYDSLVARREKASISEDVDSTRMAQFRIIDPPRVLPEPVFPNRRALAPLVLVVSFVLGAIASYLVSQFMPTVDSARALRNVTQRPVLGSVSLIQSDTLHRRARRDHVGFGLATASLLALCVLWIMWSRSAAFPL